MHKTTYVVLAAAQEALHGDLGQGGEASPAELWLVEVWEVWDLKVAFHT